MEKPENGIPMNGVDNQNTDLLTGNNNNNNNNGIKSKLCTRNKIIIAVVVVVALAAAVIIGVAVPKKGGSESVDPKPELPTTKPELRTIKPTEIPDPEAEFLIRSRPDITQPNIANTITVEDKNLINLGMSFSQEILATKYDMVDPSNFGDLSKKIKTSFDGVVQTVKLDEFKKAMEEIRPFIAYAKENSDDSATLEEIEKKFEKFVLDSSNWVTNSHGNIYEAVKDIQRAMKDVETIFKYQNQIKNFQKNTNNYQQLEEAIVYQQGEVSHYLSKVPSSLEKVPESIENLRTSLNNLLTKIRNAQNEPALKDVQRALKNIENCLMWFSEELNMIENEVKPVLEKTKRVANRIEQKVDKNVVIQDISSLYSNNLRIGVRLVVIANWNQEIYSTMVNLKDYPSGLYDPNLSVQENVEKFQNYVKQKNN